MTDVFIHLPKQYVRVVRRQDTGYVEETLTAGVWQPDALPGLRLNVDWLLREPRPDELETLQSLLPQL